MIDRTAEWQRLGDEMARIHHQMEINDRILLVLFIAFALMTVAKLVLDYRVHRHRYPK